MTELLLAVLLGALPEGSARYRFELGGESIGQVTLSVDCGRAGAASAPSSRPGRCRATWHSETRLPAEAGGELRSERFEREVDREGAELAPAFLVELLFHDVGAKERCLVVAEERSGRRQRACGWRTGAEVQLTLDGEPERVAYGVDGFPVRIDLPLQRTRFVRDPAATVPVRPPRLYGVEVPGPLDPRRGARFCGVARDPVTAADDAAALARLPRPRPSMASCREQALAWVEAARAAGGRARVAVGVAWMGGGWAWHAWGEARDGARWIAVDPAAGQWPASAARFTLATWEPDDAAARDASGRRILGCWGRARVEP